MVDVNARRGQRLASRMLFVAAIAWTLWASLVPVVALPSVSLWDKLAHALNYAMLMGLLLLALDKPRLLPAGFALAVFGVLVEFAQAMTGYRSGEWQDALANLLGIVAMGVAWQAWRQRRPAGG